MNLVGRGERFALFFWEVLDFGWFGLLSGDRFLPVITHRLSFFAFSLVFSLSFWYFAELDREDREDQELPGVLGSRLPRELSFLVKNYSHLHCSTFPVGTFFFISLTLC